MKRIFKIGLVFLFISSLIAEAQEEIKLWQKLIDSTFVFIGKKDYKNALPLCEKALAEEEKDAGKKDENYANITSTLVEICFSLKDNKKALSYSKLDSSIRFEIYGEGHLEYCKALFYLATVYGMVGNERDAEKLYLKVLNIQKEKLGTKSEEYARTLSSLGGLYEATGRFLQAEETTKEALKIRDEKSQEKDVQYALTLNNLSQIYVRLGKYSEAEPILLESMKIMNEKMGEKSLDALIAVHNLAILYNYMGRYPESEEMHNKVIKIKKEKLGENHPSYALSLNNLAAFLKEMGRYSEAEDLFKKSIKIYKETLGEKQPYYANFLTNLGSLYKTTNRYAEADSLLNEALKIRREIQGNKHPEYGGTLNSLAGCYEKMGKYDDAEKLFKETIDINLEQLGKKHPYYSTSLSNLGNLYVVTGKFSEAEKLLLEVNRIEKEILRSDHPQYMESLFNLGILYYLMGNYEKAEDYYHQALDKLFNLVYRYFPYLSEKDKLAFWNSYKDRINRFNEFASKYYLKKPEIAETMFNINLATKGLVLNSTKKAIEQVRGLKRTFENWQSTRELWVKLVQNPERAERMGIKLDSLEKVANEYEKQISSKSLNFKRAFDTINVTWKDIQKKLEMDEAVVDIIRFRTNDKKAVDSIIYVSLILTKNSKRPGIVIFENGSSFEKKYLFDYKKEINYQRKKIYDSDKLDYQMEELYKVFWGKIQALLGSVKKVFISPDGVYNQINLNTLRNPGTKSYLLDELDLKLITSTRDLESRQKENFSEQQNLAELIGDPKFNLDSAAISESTLRYTKGLSRDLYYVDNDINSLSREGVLPLPGTKVEIEKISQYLIDKQWKVNKHLEADAVEEAVKSVQNPRILHIASHGIFLKDVESGGERAFGPSSQQLSDNPLLRSMILLAGSENTLKSYNISPEQRKSRDIKLDDGLLTAYEAMNLNLDNTELVVLSACETGLGEIKNGEGVYGLQRAFQVAGAKSLIMSLWSVSDAATQELMTSFYDKWLSGKTKREAFREAQQELKKKYPGFYYWGAFVMVGE
jgi:CHAT domain-containing protein/Tfp pilus assembly protein PilF